MDYVPALSTSVMKCHALLFTDAVPVNQPPAQRTAPAVMVLSKKAGRRPKPPPGVVEPVSVIGIGVTQAIELLGRTGRHRVGAGEGEISIGSQDVG